MMGEALMGLVSEGVQLSGLPPALSVPVGGPLSGGACRCSGSCLLVFMVFIIIINSVVLDKKDPQT